METKQDNLQEFESKITDKFHRDLITWYKENPTNEYLIQKLVELIQSRKDEIKED